MNYKALTLIIIFAANAFADNQPLNVTLTDLAWDGEKVPEGQQCEKFGGKGSTPSLSVTQIPAGTNAIVMMYSDHSYAAMDQGGHGKFGYRIQPAASTATIPSIPGHTFDLPKGFFLIEAQRAPTWDKEGAYLPPCSGGKGNDYYMTVKAVREVINPATI